MLYVRIKKTQGALDSDRHHRRNRHDIFHHDAHVSVIRQSGLSGNLDINFMNWKRFLSYKHHNLSAHHHYQIGAIFLFFFGFFLFFPFYMLVQELNLDILDLQWYFFWPWLIFMLSIACECAQKFRQTNFAVRSNGRLDTGSCLESPRLCSISNPPHSTACEQLTLRFSYSLSL